MENHNYIITSDTYFNKPVLDNTGSQHQMSDDLCHFSEDNSSYSYHGKVHKVMYIFIQVLWMSGSLHSFILFYFFYDEFVHSEPSIS